MEKDHLTLENDQLIWEEDMLLSALSRSELESSVLELFPCPYTWHFFRSAIC